MIIEVQTTQNVTIDYETAGIGYRLLAYILDLIVFFIWIIGWVWIFDVMNLPVKGDEFTALLIMIAIPIVFYDLLFEILNNGQSIGKMILKIRVVNVDGTTPSTGTYLIRWLFRLIDFTLTEGFLAVIMIALTKKSQRLGDYLAGTTVINLNLDAKNKQLSLSDLDFNENYKVMFADALDRLSDKDIQTIRSIIEDDRMTGNAYFNQRLANRIKEITGYTFNGSDKAFLYKLLSDYNYLAVQDA